MDLQGEFNLARSQEVWWQSLPFNYQSLLTSVGTRPMGFRYSNAIVNIEASFNGTIFLTCGEAKTSHLAMTKAIAELLERTAMKSHVDQNPMPQIVSSNGWACHETSELASEHAMLELVERDAVLAQWYSRTPFQQIGFESLPCDLKSWVALELSQSELPILKVLLSTTGLGPSVTCILMNQNGFGVTGHSSRKSIGESIEGALAEACRAAHHFLRRSFWSDTLELQKSTSQKRIQPGAHAVYYAYHEPLPAWMFGETIGWQTANKNWNSRINQLFFSKHKEFSFRTVLDEPLCVVQATSPTCFDLLWGPMDVNSILKSTANRRLAVPLTERTFNFQPHIVS